MRAAIFGSLGSAFGGRCGRRERRARFARLALVLAAFGGGYWAINDLLLPWLYALG